jgi:hypothetical protein
LQAFAKEVLTAFYILAKVQAYPTSSSSHLAHSTQVTMSKKAPSPDKFKFITERSIKTGKYELTRWQSAQLRRKLQKGLYWLQIEKGGLIQWNWTLLHHYLLNGNTEQHQALVEEYITTLPTVV